MIFIVQDDGKKDFRPLTKYKENVLSLTTRDAPIFGDMHTHFMRMKSKMGHFDNRYDSLVLVGDPLNIGYAVHIALEKGGFVNVLKWDRRKKNYLKLTIGKEKDHGKKSS